MNQTTFSNVSLLAIAVTALSTAIELLGKSEYIGAGISAAIGIAIFYLYEKFPPSSTAKILQDEPEETKNDKQ